jgi:hypothetical protein
MCLLAGRADRAVMDYGIHGKWSRNHSNTHAVVLKNLKKALG